MYILRIILGYLKSMLPYIAVLVVVFPIFRLISLKARNAAFNIKHEIFFFLFCAMLTGIAAVTFLPKIELFPAFSIQLKFGLSEKYNYIPFVQIIDYITKTVEGNKVFLYIYLIGNIVIFIPVGFLLTLNWRITNARAILTGCAIVLFIEVVQFFTLRMPDIDDFILNMIGILIGILICRLLEKKFDASFNKCKLVA